MMFLDRQTRGQSEDYMRMLEAIGALSRLFTEDDTPYLYYRAAENIFCKAFQADNKSRSDVSVDAVKTSIGIGLKTFRHKNSQVEKIAEFNRDNNEYASLSAEDLVRFVALRRNERIETATRLFDLEQNLYHCVARKRNTFILYEVPMDKIDIDSITNISVSTSNNIISFNDGLSQYSFNRTKSTLFKKFVPPENILEFNVNIISDPYTAIATLLSRNNMEIEEITNVITPSTAAESSVVLPLYSTNPRQGEDRVPSKSGLNQWNAAGRTRHADEVYIQIPAWIHRTFPAFFPPRDTEFQLILPDNVCLRTKVCQAGGKALMSNPNNALGEWLLRKVLRLQRGEIATYEKLKNIDIDSVEIYKISDNKFTVAFKKTGTYEDFALKNAVNIA